jgi:phosphodiesterase/alkaline phosphatase D-like protein
MTLVLASPTHAQLSNWPDPIANHVIPYQSSGLTHGPILGQPQSSSMRVWVRTRQPIDFEVVYSERLPLDDSSPSMKGRTQQENDNTGFVQLDNLKPNTRYYYGVRVRKYIADTRAQVNEPWPSFKTLPDATSYADTQNNPEGLFNFSFSIGCGMRQRTPVLEDNFGIYANPPAFMNLYERHRDVAFHIVNGDYTYEEAHDGTRDGIENNYKLYLSRGRHMANWFRYVPQLYTYDDHEANSNLDGAGEVGLGAGDYLKRDPALRVWEDYAAWANEPAPTRAPIRLGRAQLKKGDDVLHDPNADFTTLKPEQVSTIHIGPYISIPKGSDRKPERYNTAKAAGGANAGVYGLVEVIDKRRLRVTPAFKEDYEADYSIGTHHYYEKRVGNCHFFFLDTRGERSRFIADKKFDPDRFILGDTQRQWLLNGVRETDADFVFVISSVPLTIFHSAYHVRPERGTDSKGDGWAGYVHEREVMLPAFDAVDKPVLVFTGDLHNSFVVQVTDNVWEFMAGPLNSSGHPIGTAGLPPFGGWFDSQGRKVKVKWLGGAPDNVHYTRLRNTYYAVVNVNNILVAGTPQGSGYQFVPYDEPQVVVQYYDGHSGKLVYAEGISTVDAKPEGAAPPKASRWPAQAPVPTKRD